MAHRRATFGYLAPILINQLIEVQASPQDECSICLERVNGKKLNPQTVFSDSLQAVPAVLGLMKTRLALSAVER